MISITYGWSSRVIGLVGRRRGVLAALWVPLFVSASCDAPDRDRQTAVPAAPSHTEADSAGIRILTIDLAAASAPLGWNIDPAPAEEFGPGDGDGFVSVEGVVQSPTGRVAILDGEARLLYLWEHDSGLIAQSGGVGEGPGEFGGRGRFPVMVSTPTETDSVLVYDYPLRRHTRFSLQDGWADGSIRADLPEGARDLVGLLESRVLVRGQSGIDDYNLSGARDATATYSWTDWNTGETKLLGSWRVQPDYRIPPGDLIPGPLGVRRFIPLAVRPLGVLSEGGPVIAGAFSHEIRRFDREGDLHKILRLEGSRRPVTPDDRLGMRNLALVGRPDSIQSGRLFDAIPLPDSMPAFTALRIDTEGWIWAELPEWDPTLPKTWIVFDEDGWARGSVTAPPALDVQWVGRESVLGVWTDDLGRQYVRRHALTRH